MHFPRFHPLFFVAHLVVANEQCGVNNDALGSIVNMHDVILCISACVGVV